RWPGRALCPRQIRYEVEKDAQLRGRQVSRRMEGIERKELVRPVREELDHLASFKEVAEAELHHLRDALSCDAGGAHRCRVIDDEATGGGDLDRLAVPLERPSERPTGRRIAEQDAFMPAVAELRRMRGPAVLCQI